MTTQTRYTSWNINASAGKPRCSPQTRMEQGRKFKAMFSSVGLSVVDVAKFLQVSPRAVQLRVAGRGRIRFAGDKSEPVQPQDGLSGEVGLRWPHFC